MSTLEMPTGHTTHEVTNQASPLENYNVFTADPVLVEALRGRRLAYALLAEPVDPGVEAERLAFRRAYRDVFAELIAEGSRAGELPGQDPELAGAALVGAIGEALVGPLSPTAARRDTDALVAALRDFCVRSVTGEKEPALVNA